MNTATMPMRKTITGVMVMEIHGSVETRRGEGSHSETGLRGGSCLTRGDSRS